MPVVAADEEAKLNFLRHAKVHFRLLGCCIILLSVANIAVECVVMGRRLFAGIYFNPLLCSLIVGVVDGSFLLRLACRVEKIGPRSAFAALFLSVVTMTVFGVGLAVAFFNLVSNGFQIQIQIAQSVPDAGDTPENDYSRVLAGLAVQLGVSSALCGLEIWQVCLAKQLHKHFSCTTLPMSYIVLPNSTHPDQPSGFQPPSLALAPAHVTNVHPDANELQVSLQFRSVALPAFST